MLKKYFITGLLIWVPIVITLWVLDLLVTTMDLSLTLVPDDYHPDRLLGVHIPGLGVVLTLAVVLITGLLTANFVGRRVLAAWDSLLNRIPVVKTIYSSVKQVSDTLFSSTGHAFRKVLLVRYPHPQAWSLAFQTNIPGDVAPHLGSDYVAVFIPTAPSPVNGFYFYVRREDTIEVDIGVDEALKYIVSMGVVNANGRRAGKALPPSAARPL
jgi:uncharacterized membrane protein